MYLCLLISTFYKTLKSILLLTHQNLLIPSYSLLQNCTDELVIVKNRFCCPKDSEPLITILDKKVCSYEMHITCKSCESIYKKEK